MKRTWLIAAVAAHAAGCSDSTTTTLTELNLDRPIDVSFACYGEMRMTGGGAPAADQMVIPTAQPIAACERLSPQITPTLYPITPLPGQQTDSTLPNNPTLPKWYAFILQSTAGTVAIGSWSTRAADVTGSGQTVSASSSAPDFQVLDADPLTPGKNAIAIGEDPVAIGTDPSGCFELTANAGSCDLSELQINSVLSNLDGNDKTAPTKVQVLRRPVKTPSGKTFLARPAAMIVEPGLTVADPTANPRREIPPDPAEAVSKMGLACPDRATGVVYVAYPSCHLVAGINAGTGQLVSGLRFEATGTKVLNAAELEDLPTTCPVECGAASGSVVDPTPDAPRPVTLSYRFDARVGSSVLAIGADNSNLITVVTLDRGFALDGTSTRQIELQLPATPANASRKLGVSSVALSPQIGIGGQFDKSFPVATFDDGRPQAQYVYAVANDATVRVVDLMRDPPRECDTQIDGHAVRARIKDGASLTDVDLACMKYATPELPRRLGAKGPGIELPLFGAPGNAVPLSVAIVHGRSVPGPVSTTDTTFQTPAPSVWLGYFAAISSSTGDVYTVNVDDDYAPDTVKSSSDFLLQMQTSPALVMAHQLRDGFTARDAVPAVATASSTDTCHAVDPTGGVLAGGPRATTAPAQAIPTGTLSDAKKFELPTLQSLSCLTAPTQPPTNTVMDDVIDARISQVQFGAPSATRDQVFPDLGSIRSETWTMTYESTLSLDGLGVAVDGPPVRKGAIKVDEFGMTINDAARPFCDMGVQPFDIVELRGCNAANGNNDCPKGYECFVHPKSAVSIGACMLANEKAQLADACEAFLTTQRVYTAGQAADGSLVLLERKHELPNTPIGGCDPDPTLNQCNNLASQARQIGAISDADPFVASPSKTSWACRHDSLRAPVNADPAKDLRCIQTCDTDPANLVVCSTGTVCRHDTPTSTTGVCMEGVQPPQACVQGPQSYAVRASEAFTVIGSVSGYVHPVVRQTDGSCSVPSPTAPTLQTGRIPLRSLPACGPAGGPNRPNPCLRDQAQNDPVPQFDFQPMAPLGCTADPPSVLTARTQLGVRQTRGIEFRNAAMVLTMVDPYKDCALDLHSGQDTTPVTIPLVPRGYQLQFVVRGGLTPFTLPLSGAAILPARVLRGPSESLWVIDEGDFLGISQPMRGQVFRFESTNVNAVNALR